MITSLPLNIHNVTAGFGHPLFQNVSLQIKPKEFVSLMGENGSGKTTLIEILLDCKKPQKGSVTFWGQPFNASTRAQLNQKIGWVMSFKENYPPLVTVTQFLKMIRPYYPTWNDELVLNLLERFALDPRKQLTHLSLGENSKLKLLKALAFEPSLLILDELTANLSEKSKEAIQEILIDLFSRKNMSVFYVCHFREEALRLSDKIYVLEADSLKEK